MFNIIVCAKQVPDTNEIKINPETGSLIRDGVPSILNPDDANALEEALKLKDTDPENIHVTVVSMGPPQAQDMLFECIAMGADEAVLLSDRAVGGSDTWATSNAITAVIKKLPFDMIFSGRQAIDGDTAQVGPQIAEKLNLPQVTYVQKFEIAPDKKSVKVQRQLEDGYEVIEAPIPCMLTCTKELNTPRYMNMAGIFNPDKKITVWNAKDVEVDLTTVGLKASPTNVFKSFTPKPKGKGTMLDGDTEKDIAQKLVGSLKKKHVI
ncbi:MAG: electron transfer flavoprotein subunit beta/FixA family protein [Firmicutes bacterium]|nr:electron transfer flavoprotein subunit beta/FixA family protein [Eubacterium sp.]MBR3052764.1 electron transfer flavoprotein subunit beta/FixA family protein [Bacillota bacterium]MBR3211568.1 electron transfer flavoprotein subunit beta/FixA family protein [Bacillota bacterium]MCR4669027.1 electron transfer flavoprotein subunit beta/FixA family protein [Clostridia bacterium]